MISNRKEFQVDNRLKNSLECDGSPRRTRVGYPLCALFGRSISTIGNSGSFQSVQIEALNVSLALPKPLGKKNTKARSPWFFVVLTLIS
jgi:hypothetical protein